MRINYIIETHDFNSGVPTDDGWDEINCKGSLCEANAEYVKQLATHDTLRIVRETRVIIAQFCKAPKIISEFEQSLNETSKYIYDYLVTFLKTREHSCYSCDIQIANGDAVNELSLSNDGQTIKVSLYWQDMSIKLSQLSIEDQLTIVKAVAENQ